MHFDKVAHLDAAERDARRTIGVLLETNADALAVARAFDKLAGILVARGRSNEALEQYEKAFERAIACRRPEALQLIVRYGDFLEARHDEHSRARFRVVVDVAQQLQRTGAL